MTCLHPFRHDTFTFFWKENGYTSSAMTCLHPLCKDQFTSLWLWHIHSRRSIHTSLVTTNIQTSFTRYTTLLCSWYIHTSFDMKILHSFRHDTFTPYQWNVQTSLAMTCLHLFDDDMFTPLGNDLSAPLRSRHVHIPYVTTRLLHFGGDLFAPFRQWPVRTISVTTCSYPFCDNKETYERVFLSEIKKRCVKRCIIQWSLNN